MSYTSNEDELHRLEARYVALTGQEGYLYAYAPGDQYGKRYVFNDGGQVSFGARAALNRMQALLADAQRRQREAEASAEQARQEADFDQRYIRFSHA